MSDTKKKVTRVRTGCWTCKKRRRKCDESKPECQNCIKTGRKCEGYEIRLTFNNNNDLGSNANGTFSSAKKGSVTFMNFQSSNDDNNNNIGNTNKRKTERDESKSTKMMKADSSTNSISATPIPSAIDKREASPIFKSVKKAVDDNNKDEVKIDGSRKQSSTSTTVTATTTTTTDITDPFQFESALYGGLDYLLSFPMSNADSGTSPGTNTTTSSSTAQPDQSTSNPMFPLTPSIFEFLDAQRDSPHPEGMNSNNNNTNNNNDFNVDLSTFIDNTNLYPSIQATNEEVDDYELVNPQHRQQLLAYHQQFNSATPQEDHQNPTTTNDNSKFYANDIKSLSNTLEDKMMLKHFFDKLLPLLDSHPNSPWPELALKYCDIEIARSCFISLSCIHLYEQGGENEFYKRGMLHINNTMEYLVKYMKSNQRRDYYKQLQKQQNSNGLTISKIVDNLKDESDNEKQKQTNFFVILLLIYVHLLFGILESGRSALSRVFLSLFASISEDKAFQKVMSRIDQSQTLICVLSWFDTICAVISPDCRLPYCNPLWYGKKHDLISTAKMNGCPGEIFKSIAEICKIRHDIKMGKLKNHLDKSLKFERVKFQILNYRDYVPLRDNGKLSYSYEDRLHGAQCWSLASYIKLLEVCQIDLDYESSIKESIKEFIITYKTLNPKNPIRTQMVWPIFLVATKCTDKEDQMELLKFMNKLYETVKMGTIITMIKIVNQVWETGLSSEEILGGKEWLNSGIDYLPI